MITKPTFVIRNKDKNFKENTFDPNKIIKFYQSLHPLNKLIENSPLYLLAVDKYNKDVKFSKTRPPIPDWFCGKIDVETGKLITTPTDEETRNLIGLVETPTTTISLPTSGGEYEYDKCLDSGDTPGSTDYIRCPNRDENFFKLPFFNWDRSFESGLAAISTDFWVGEIKQNYYKKAWEQLEGELNNLYGSTEWDHDGVCKWEWEMVNLMRQKVYQSKACWTNEQWQKLKNAYLGGCVDEFECIITEESRTAHGFDPPFQRLELYDQKFPITPDHTIYTVTFEWYLPTDIPHNSRFLIRSVVRNDQKFIGFIDNDNLIQVVNTQTGSFLGVDNITATSIKPQSIQDFIAENTPKITASSRSSASGISNSDKGKEIWKIVNGMQVRISANDSQNLDREGIQSGAGGWKSIDSSVAGDAVQVTPNSDGSVTATATNFTSPRTGITYKFVGFKVISSKAPLVRAVDDSGVIVIPKDMVHDALRFMYVSDDAPST